MPRRWAAYGADDRALTSTIWLLRAWVRAFAKAAANADYLHVLYRRALGCRSDAQELTSCRWTLTVEDAHLDQL